MPKTETLEDFYRGKFNWLPDDLKKDIGHFNVFNLDDCVKPDAQPVQYTRRDFYKIALMRGQYLYHYADKSVEVSGTTLIFFNPQVPYTFEQLSGTPSGYFCIFKEAFFTERLRGGIKDLPMFIPGNKPGYILDETQDEYLSHDFRTMMDDVRFPYRYKYGLIRHSNLEIVHHPLQTQPTETLHQHTAPNTRITPARTGVRERPFPRESTSLRLTLRPPRD